MNPGARVHVAAAIVNSKVRVWHYLPRRWCADAACDFYEGVLAPVLRRCRKGKGTFRILEDNDPTGYKSKKAIDCKRPPQVAHQRWGPRRYGTGQVWLLVGARSGDRRPGRRPMVVPRRQPRFLHLPPSCGPSMPLSADGGLT